MTSATLLPSTFIFSLASYAAHPDLHSFPTRRSSDLGASVSTLTEVASDDDEGGFLTSAVQFNASANTAYHIAVDGLAAQTDRKSTRLNSSHGYISYAVFCLKKKNTR